ncbi:MAG: trypsin-like peptidase domain-containing protein [Eubacteriales bacterium]|nr:trypsin-like peptidase domain-containing protein [Eubacteriales bacterium]
MFDKDHINNEEDTELEVTTEEKTVKSDIPLDDNTVKAEDSSVIEESTDEAQSTNEQETIINEESPLIDDISATEVEHTPSKEEVLNLGFEPKSPVNSQIPTYYKKPSKKNNVFLACLITFIATLFLVVAGLGITGYIARDGDTPKDNSATHQNKESSKASTLEQLAKKEGSEMSIVDIANKVGPAVCGIVIKAEVQSFFGTQVAEGSGSGIIISEDGYIVTNQHVIENASAINVILSTGKEYSAVLVGQDVSTDLAVIKIEEKNLPTAEFGYSSELQVGELAIAIGNPLGQEFAGSVTVGVISALNRTVSVENRSYTLIQTDAAINSGNSGGALVNSFGQVVGINSLKVSSAEGLGFAIPIDFAKPIIDDLIDNGHVKGRPVIGVSLREVDASMSQQYNVPEGLYVVAVTEFGAAEKAGLIQGDVIITADGQKVSTVAELNAIKNKKSVGDTVILEIKRSRGNDISKWDNKKINVILGEETVMP